jgi:hypothetical protein
MPDEFPTLEVVAFIGVLAALVGMLQLRRGLREIPKLTQGLENALKAGDLARARAVAAEAEGAWFVRIGSALVEALGREPRPKPRELEALVAQARRRAVRAVQRGRARDLVVAAVLIGAAAYAVRASLGVGPAFYALLAAALVMTALGPLLRRSLLDAVVKASERLERAASTYLTQRATAPGVPCPECGSRDTLELGLPVLEGVRDLGLTELYVCRQCGLVRGRIQRPDAIGLDAGRGVRLAARETELESSAEPDHEHQG